MKHLIQDGSCSVLSLDIFDTVLWRRVPRPTDVFAVLGARLRREGAVFEWLEPNAFRRMRIAAEERARVLRGDLGSEVSLPDIWRQIPRSVLRHEDLARYVTAEVEVESGLLMVDLDVAEIIDSADKSGVPIVLVSDTYFMQQHLEQFLDRPHLTALKAARIFRSHEYGVDKAHGLWDAVISAIGVAPSQIVHVGDNETADVTVPSELGVRTVHLERINRHYSSILEREGEPLDPFGAVAPRLDELEGDFGVTSLRAKVLAGSNLDDVTPEVACSWRYGATVLGPVLTGFAEWVARRAYERGVTAVWCPMREGDMLASLINKAARSRGWDVTATPIWLSRHVTSIASLGRLDPDTVHDFIRRRYGLTVGGLLASLALRPGDVPALAPRLNAVLDNGVIAAEVSHALIETAYVRNRIAATTTGVRERLIKHLRSVGALDAPELVLVDLGWGGTIQAQLADALELAGLSIRPAGLYLATDERSVPVMLSGLQLEGYLGTAGEPAQTVEVLTRSPEIIEQAVSSLCGSLLDFDGEGQPVLGSLAGPAHQITARRGCHEGIAAFQNEWIRYRAADSERWPDLVGREVERMRHIIASSLRSPTLEEAAVFGKWEREDNFGTEVVTHLAPAHMLPAVPYMSPGDLDDLHMRDGFWPQLLASTDPALATASRAVTTGVVPASVFEPAEPIGQTSLRYKTGDSRWHDGPKAQVRVNRNGLSFARLHFEAFDATDVALAIPGRPAIVRVDWIEATVVAGGHRVTEPLRWDRPHDFAELVYAECVWLGGNLIEFHSPHAAVWLPLAERAGGPISSAHVSIAFAVLPQSTSGLSARVPPAQRFARLAGRARTEFSRGGTLAVAAAAARIIRRRADSDGGGVEAGSSEATPPR